MKFKEITRHLSILTALPLLLLPAVAIAAQAAGAELWGPGGLQDGKGASHFDFLSLVEASLALVSVALLGLAMWRVHRKGLRVALVRSWSAVLLPLSIILAVAPTLMSSGIS